MHMSDANSIINGYTLFSVLGTGSQGTVYRARKNDQIFAVKVVLKRILNKVIPNTKQSLQNLLDTEIKIMKIIKSDYVVSLIDEFQTQQKHYIVMEYCDGGTLEKLIQQKRISIADSNAIIEQIKEGLAALHKSFVIHRDLKPQNILKNRNQYKIADLGYARVLEAQDLAITQIGTPLYMAPEILERQPYNNKVDFWSMGLIFYKMIYGKLPWKFTSANHGAMINTIYKTKIDFSQVEISESARNFIKGCLQINPNKRFGWEDILKHQLFNSSKLFTSNQDWPRPRQLLVPPLVVGNQEQIFHTAVSVSQIYTPPVEMLQPILPEPLPAPSNVIKQSQQTLRLREETQRVFKSNSRIIRTEINKLSLLFNYIVVVRDTIAKSTYDNSRKLSELRLSVAQRCIRKIEAVNQIFQILNKDKDKDAQKKLKQKLSLKFERFEEFSKSNSFEQLKKLKQIAYQRIKKAFDEISSVLFEIQNRPTQKLKDFFNQVGGQYKQRKSILDGFQGLDYTFEQHTLFVGNLFKSMSYKFKDFTKIPANFNSYMTVFLMKQYRVLALTLVKEDQDLSNMERIVEWRDEVEKKPLKWAVEIEKMIYE